MSKFHSGFSLIEIMVVVSIIGILTTIAIRFVDSYSARAKISEVLAIAARGKVGVAEFCFANGIVPANAGEAAFDTDSTFSQYIKQVQYTKVSDDLAQLEYQLTNMGAGVEDKWVMLAGTCGSAIMNWDCTTDDDTLIRYLPANCR